MSAVGKYLSRYAEPECQCLQGFPTGFQQGIVVPVYREKIATLNRLIGFAEAHTKTLLIVVVNRPDNDHSNDWSQAFFKQSYTIQWQTENRQLTLHSLANDSALLLIDRCINGPPIPQSQGVGLARKIGADVLCQLIAGGNVCSPWIANTDADAILPDDYINRLQTLNTQAAAAIFPFKHYAPDGGSELAMLLYEFSLHYYVAGLHWAGSAYAYHTIGSIIAVHYRHYSQVRGFPKRSAAEDFYLLNKLTKTGDIIQLAEPVIQIEGRQSTRVPFGTGPAIKKLAESEQLLAMPLYHPASFVYLKGFLAALRQAAGCTQQPTIAAIAEMAANTAASLNHSVLSELIETLGTQQAIAHSFQQGKQEATRWKHLCHWFDAFKTLKLIHWLRDHSLGTITVNQALDGHDIDPYRNQPLRDLATRIKALIV